MKSLLPFSLLLSAASALSLLRDSPQTIFKNKPVFDHDIDNAAWHFPTVHESVIQARRILHLASLGWLVTTFPDDHANHESEILENRPSNVGGAPIALMEYIADCADEDGNYGNPTMLAINIATPFRNYKQGSNISLSLRWWPDQKYTYGVDAYDHLASPHTPVSLPRFSLIGHLELINMDSIHGKLTQACFMAKHPDSVLWQPGNDIHESTYVRFVVDHLYWLGGFGDRARIQWMPIEEWRNVTMSEVEDIRLPGEKAKSNWRESWRQWKEWL